MPCLPLHQTWQTYPPAPSIKHRCLAYCYTKHGRSTGRSTSLVNWACWCCIDMRNTECPFDTRNMQIVLYRPSTISAFSLFWHSLSLSCNWPSTCSWNTHSWLASFLGAVTLQLTACMQLKCSLVLLSFLLSSICNWPSSGVCVVYNIPSVHVKGTSSVLWSSANFCNISQNMHYKAPVAAQHWKTNKVVCTWKDDWPPGELLLMKDLLPKRVTIYFLLLKLIYANQSGRSTEMRCSTRKTFYPRE